MKKGSFGGMGKPNNISFQAKARPAPGKGAQPARIDPVIEVAQAMHALNVQRPQAEKKQNIERKEAKNEVKEVKEAKEGELARVPLPLDCEGEYIRDFLPREKRAEYFRVLLDAVPWESLGMNRQTCLYGDDDVSYNYGKGYDDEKRPMPWLPVLVEIRDQIEALLQIKFDVCLCGWYANGQKGIGFHCDREELDKDTPIASITLGAERWFEFKEKGPNKEVCHRMMLHDGSLLVMGPDCQHKYLHCLPIDRAIRGGRINLTFRNSTGIRSKRAAS